MFPVFENMQLVTHTTQVNDPMPSSFWLFVVHIIPRDVWPGLICLKATASTSILYGMNDPVVCTLGDLACDWQNYYAERNSVCLISVYPIRGVHQVQFISHVPYYCFPSFSIWYIMQYILHRLTYGRMEYFSLWKYFPVENSMVIPRSLFVLVHGSLTRCVKLWDAHALRMPGTFPPPPILKETAS